MHYKHFKIEYLNGVAVVRIDKESEPVNVLSPDMFEETRDVLHEVLCESLTKAIVITSDKKDFVLGADISSFEKIISEGAYPELATKVHELFSFIENAHKPIVAAIHGICFGAGLELSLACHARIASDDSSTQFALPEVKLGLLPGAGGCTRLPALIGLQPALDIMLTGRTVYAKSALKLGLVNSLVHKNKLVDAACSLALSLVNKPLKMESKQGLFMRVIEKAFPSILFNEAKKLVDKQTMGNYPAPYKIIETVKDGWTRGKEFGIKSEVKNFEELLKTPQSKELISIFFNMTNRKKNPYAKAVPLPNSMAIIGAGFMGEGIAEVSLKFCPNIILKDLKAETAIKAKSNIWHHLQKKIRNKIINKNDAVSQLAQIKTSLKYEDLRYCDIVIEAVFEDLSVKQDVLKSCESFMKPDAVFASNTSALPITDIAKNAIHKNRIVGMHYFSPVPKMPLLEIVKTKDTSTDVIARCFELGIKQGKTCIVVNDGPGFYTTRILAPMLNEALLLLDEGADAQQVDKALKIFGFPVGPVTLIDEVGIDVGAHIMTGDLIKYFEKRPGLKISPSMQTLYKAGFYGRKNGKGFYVYTGKKKTFNSHIYQYFGGPSRKSFSEEEIVKRCAYIFMNEAIYCLQDHIIESPSDGDIGAIFGLGFPPFTGGPFRFLHQYGLVKFRDEMIQLQGKHGDRFAPAELLNQYIQESKMFY